MKPVKKVSVKNVPVRLAIAGLGLIGRRHAEAIRHVPETRLCAVVDPSESGRAEAAALGLPCYERLDAMIEAEAPDGLILATPTPLHAAQGRQSIEAGIPVLIEKPLADNLADAEALVVQSEAAGVAVMVGHHRRFNPIIHQAHAIIREGRIGDVRSVQATCWFYKPDSYFDIAPWRKRDGAGPVSVNLVHDVDLIRHLCGEITQVQAQASPSARGYENEDVAAALLRFENGAIGTVCVSDSIASPWSWEFTARENPVYPFTGQSSYQIGGSLGSLSVPDLALWTHDPALDWWSPMSRSVADPEEADPLINQIQHFADVIRGEAEPQVSGREGLRTLAVIEAIQVAAKTGRTIQLAGASGEEKLVQFTRGSDNNEPTKPAVSTVAL